MARILLEVKSVRSLIGEALSDARRILDRHRQTLLDLGIQGKQRNPDVARVISETMEKIGQTKERASSEQIRPLLRLLCSVNILSSFQGLATAEDDNEDPRGVYLISFWHGVLMCATWMDEEAALKAFKHLYASEMGRAARSLRPKNEAVQLMECLRILRRKLKAARQSNLYQCAVDTLESRKTSKFITLRRLILAHLDPGIESAVKECDALWDTGDERLHDEMTEVFSSGFESLDIESLKILRQELLVRFRELAKTKHPSRLRGVSGNTKAR